MDTAPRWSCRSGEPLPRDCNDAYLDLARARSRRDPAAYETCVATGAEELLAARDRILGAGIRPPAAIDAVSLSEQVRTALRLDVLAQLPLVLEPGTAVRDPVAELGPVIERAADPVTRGGAVLEREIVFDDPAVGRFPARLLLPRDRPSPPAVLFLGGHLPDRGGQIDDAIELRGGRELAAAGYAVLVPGFRAYSASVQEADAVVALRCAGLSLAGVHQHEAALALSLLDLLRADGTVGPGTAVVGHSGGAVHAVLLSAWQDVDAVVVDAVADRFLNVQRVGPEEVQIIDETVPELAPLWPCLYAFPEGLGPGDPVCERTGGVPPTLRIPYGFDAEGRARTRAFVGEWL
ncbi:MAG: hypothetical protein H6742_11715 [Alphaproteobacteria bacterium]|nr:hypothetical protein [Alphaproteobacteria bacterium]